MHDVAELMEVCLHLVMLQQRWSVSRRLAEVGNHGRNRHLSGAVGEKAAWLQAEAGGVSILSLPARDVRYRCRSVFTVID